MAEMGPHGDPQKLVQKKIHQSKSYDTIILIISDVFTTEKRDNKLIWP